MGRYPSDLPVFFMQLYFQIQIQTLILRNIQLTREHNKMNLQLIHVIKISIDLQLWIIVNGGWY